MKLTLFFKDGSTTIQYFADYIACQTEAIIQLHQLAIAATCT